MANKENKMHLASLDEIFTTQEERDNAAGTATTYDYGNHSETYIKDNFGNVEVESKSYDNYRETKLK